MGIGYKAPKSLDSSKSFTLDLMLDTGLILDIDGTIYPRHPRARLPQNALKLVASSLVEDGSIYEAVIYTLMWGAKTFSDGKTTGLKRGVFYAFSKPPFSKGVREDHFRHGAQYFFENRVENGFLNVVKNFTKLDKNIIFVSRNPFTKYIVESELFPSDYSKISHISSKIKLKDGFFDGLNLLKGEEKLSKTRRYVESMGLTLNDFTSIGDTKDDIPLGKECRYFLAAPDATNETLKAADYHIRNWDVFAKLIQREMQ